MKIDQYKFLIQLYFHPPVSLETYESFGIEYDGFEENIEEIWAGNPDQAMVNIKKIILKKIGKQKYRLAYLKIEDITGLEGIIRPRPSWNEIVQNPLYKLA